MCKEYDFSNAKRAKDVPHLSKLQSEETGKTRITIMLDNDIISNFRLKAKNAGVGYQVLKGYSYYLNGISCHSYSFEAGTISSSSKSSDNIY